MDHRTVFKLAALSELAANGVDPDQFSTETIKTAEAGIANWLGGRFGKAVDVGTDFAGRALDTTKNLGVGLGLPILGVGPFAAGFLVGAGGAKAMDIDRTDVKAEQTRELIQLHRDYLARLEAARRAARP